MTDRPSHLALRELRIDFTNPKGLAALLGVGVIFGVSGPFETFAQLTLVPRIAYWIVVVFATYATGSLINHYLQFRFGDRLGPFAIRTVVLGLATGCGVMIVLSLINTAIFGSIYSSWESVALTFLMVTAISIIVVGMLLLFSPLIDAENDLPALLDRLPLEKRGALVSLSVEDHYVNITTIKGAEMVLMRLSDAIKETKPTEGLQVHRSHWVANEAIVEARRVGDRAILKMTHGPEIPASRSYISELRDAGIFAKTKNG